MYKFKTNLKDELLEGRTVTYISNLTGYSRVYISEIINGSRNINEDVAMKIIIPIANQSVKLKNDIKEYSFNYLLNKFFVEV